MDTFEQARNGALAPPESAWDLQVEVVKHVDEYWSTPDYGIWETRGPPLHFVYSKVMAWVAFDRAVKAIERYGLPGPVDEWRATRTRIHAEICEHGFDAERNTFRSAYGETTLDASLLLMAQVGFIGPKDPRYIGTIEAIEKNLLVDGFVKRYDTVETDDGLEPGEGAFLACSFWLADAYVSIGRRDDAEMLYKRLLSTRNDLGLLAEEYDTRNRRLIGNFPQAFSHVGLINTAFNLTRAARPAEQRAKVNGSGVQSPEPPTPPQQPGSPNVSPREPSSKAR